MRTSGRGNSKTVIFAIIAAVCVIAAGAVGYTVYQGRKPQPVSIDLSGQAPDSIDVITDDVITDFATSNAPTMILAQAEDFVVLDGVLVGYTGWSEYVVIPDNLGIIEIKDDAFAHSGIVSVVIPYGVTTIGFGAFDNCKNLETVTIPDSVTNIKAHAFHRCSSLTSVTIPNSVTAIGREVFSDCESLTSVTIPDSVTSIEIYTFSGCSGLTSVTIPNSVTSIRDRAFARCRSLTSVTIPNSVTRIGDYAFFECTGLQQFVVDQNNNSYTSVGGTIFNKNMTSLIQFPSGRTGSYTIPNSVTRIGDYAFSYSSLTSVTIPNSVTSIGEGAFLRCGSLTSITIPSSITSIEEGVFYGCASLLSITIPDSVTSIDDLTFYECTSLTSVTIPDSVTSIGDYTFYGCTSLKQITVVPNGGGPAYIQERLGEFEFVLFFGRGTHEKTETP